MPYTDDELNHARCLVVFTQEFEGYLQAKFKKNIDFQKQFDIWYKTGQGSIDYTRCMLEFLNARL
jgi:hypothetical protein